MAEQNKGKLYEYAIIHHPRVSKNDADNGIRAESKVLIQPTQFIARDEKDVLLVAARDIPVEYTSRLDEVEVLIRPF